MQKETEMVVNFVEETISERSQIERIERIKSNWSKTEKLYCRSEFSTVAIRAATTVELAANLVIEHEFIEKRNLPVDFVEGLMKWANGFMGKLDRLIIPIYKNTTHEKLLKEIRERSKFINDERNGVVHRGEFKQRATALKLINDAAFVVNSLVSITGKDFHLKISSFENEVDDD